MNNDTKYQYSTGKEMENMHCELLHMLQEKQDTISSDVSMKEYYQKYHDFEIMKSKLRVVPLSVLNRNYFN